MSRSINVNGHRGDLSKLDAPLTWQQTLMCLFACMVIGAFVLTVVLGAIRGP